MSGMKPLRLLASPVLAALLIAGSALGNGSQAKAWSKLCEKTSAVPKNKDANAEKKDLDICLTYHERVDRNTGMVLMAAAVREIEGRDTRHLMIMVPLGVILQRGVRVSIFPEPLWEEAQRNEESNAAGLKSLTLAYTICHAAGCVAEMELTPDVLASLTSSAGFVAHATRESGASVAFSVSLGGFAQALEGAPAPRTPTAPMRCDQGFWRGCSVP
jgi:invasion protein IalB